MSRQISVDHFVSMNNHELLEKIREYLKGRKKIRTDELRRVFGISGYKAACMLRYCGFTRWSVQKNKTCYRRDSEE